MPWWLIVGIGVGAVILLSRKKEPVGLDQQKVEMIKDLVRKKQQAFHGKPVVDVGVEDDPYGIRVYWRIQLAPYQSVGGSTPYPSLDAAIRELEKP